jgi:hypothetical protein
LLLNQQTLTGVNTSIQLWNHANSNVYHVDSPGPADNPVQRTQGLLHRVEATKATFLAIYHPIEQPVKLLFEHTIPSGDAYWEQGEFTIGTTNNSWICIYHAKQGLTFIKNSHDI